MLWAHVSALSESVPGIDGPSGRSLERFANMLTSGAASWRYHPEGRLWVAVNDWIYCPMCGPAGVSQVVYEASNPHWMSTLPGSAIAFDGPATATRSYYDQVADGSIRHVPASEPLTWLSRSYLGTTRFVRAVGVDASSGEVNAALYSEALDVVPTYDELATPSGPALHSDEGYGMETARSSTLRIQQARFPSWNGRAVRRKSPVARWSSRTGHSWVPGRSPNRR